MSTSARNWPRWSALRAIAVSAAERHNCVLRAEGRIDCWGYNSNGVLGNGTLAPSPTPTAVALP